MNGTSDDTTLAALVEAIAGTPWMTTDQGRRVFTHVRQNRPERLLDIGTCYGTSAAYMAAACRSNGVGRVVTVDSGQFDDQVEIVKWCHDLWDRCGVTDLIDVVRINDSNYAWWLMEQVARQVEERGGEPTYDFAYLDGAKWLTLDTAAVVFIEQLLRPGGWLLMDDLDWSYAEHPELEPLVSYPASNTSYTLSDAEKTMPQLRAVFDLVVKRHPSFTEFIEQDGQWGWARKMPGATPRLRLEVSEARPRAVDQLKWVAAALKKRLRRP